MNQLYKLFFTACIVLSFNISFALPPCEYGDLVTSLKSPENWAMSLLDIEYKLPADYVPTELVPLTEAGFDDERLVKKILIEDLSKMRQDAADLGHPIVIQSAYRSYEYQERVFNYWVKQEGMENALLTSARAGHSEHQLGTVLDFRSEDGAAPWDLEDWAETPAGGWMSEHAWEYGFIMSYPKDKQEESCYSYEPWHYRYIGKEYAEQWKVIHDATGMTLREWLWVQQP